MSPTRELSAAFARGLESSAPPRAAHAAGLGTTHDPTLEARFADAFARARAPWPAIHVPPAQFAFYLGTVAPDAPLDILQSPQLAELYLVCACLQGVTSARDAFRSAYRADIRQAIRGIQRDDSQVDEIEQIVLTKILFPSADQQGLRGYTGRGTLKSWLKVSAVRTALNAVEKKKHEVALNTGAMAAIAAVGDDAEMALARRVHGQAFREALDAALAEMEPREREILKASYVENASVDVIAQRFAVHRATAARWVVAAEAELASKLRGSLRKRLAVRDEDLDSIMRQVDGDVANTLRRHLSEIE